MWLENPRSGYSLESICICKVTCPPPVVYCDQNPNYVCGTETGPLAQDIEKLVLQTYENHRRRPVDRTMFHTKKRWWVRLINYSLNRTQDIPAYSYRSLLFGIIIILRPQLLYTLLSKTAFQVTNTEFVNCSSRVEKGKQKPWVELFETM